jgi:spermidine/putrescine transport system substrate-binding protein
VRDDTPPCLPGRDDARRRGTGHTRRDALRLAGLAGLAAAGVAAAGCGETPAPAPKPTPSVGSAAWWGAQRRHGHVNFANWPLYIDPSHQTLKQFTAATGITVSYAEVIQDNGSWYDEISPILRKGQAIGYDSWCRWTRS